MLGGMNNEEFKKAMSDSFPDPDRIEYINLVNFMFNKRSG